MSQDAAEQEPQQTPPQEERKGWKSKSPAHLASRGLRFETLKNTLSAGEDPTKGDKTTLKEALEKLNKEQQKIEEESKQ